MSTGQFPGEVPARYSVPAAVVLLVTLAYAVFTARVFLWVLGVVGVGSVALLVFVVSLLYRTTLAVEKMADDQ